MKRLRTQIADRILEEEVKNDEHSKRKSQTKTPTNEGGFKMPGPSTPNKKNSGNNSKSRMDTSMTSQSQPQAHAN
jgi:hypothetical protein